MDIVVGILLGIITLVIYPFIWVLIKLDDGGPLFFTQKRVGKDDSEIKITKLRTMYVRENVDFENDSKSRVTRIGNFLRKSRIDEIPQIWCIIKGEQSLIGPRPELPALVKKYEQQISYYKVRHLIKPGLSGWAQIYHDNHPHHGIDVEQTKEKLSYDLYYVKNRSFLLDLKIALRTIAQLLSRKGR
jgi:lipopolysaccharide/colanic/teichoic acid biosynthesis glycosyltransferase